MIEPKASVIDQPADLADKTRVVAFSDNVISIAITLLVLGIAIPDTWVDWKNPKPLEFAPVLKYLAPRLFSFVLSFAIVGVYWVAHHQIFQAMEKAGRPILWLNNLYLLMVTLVPASAELLSEYPGQTVSVVLYGINVSLVGVAMLVMWNYGVRFNHRRGLMIDANVIRVAYVRIITAIAIYLIGLPVAFLSPWTAECVYAVVPLMYIVLQLRPASPKIADKPAP